MGLEAVIIDYEDVVSQTDDIKESEDEMYAIELSDVDEKSTISAVANSTNAYGISQVLIQSLNGEMGEQVEALKELNLQFTDLESALCDSVG